MYSIIIGFQTVLLLGTLQVLDLYMIINFCLARTAKEALNQMFYIAIWPIHFLIPTLLLDWKNASNQNVLL